MVSDNQFNTLMESVHGGIAVIQNEQIVFVNNYLCKRFGATKNEIIGKHFLEFIPEPYQQHSKGKYAELISRQKIFKDFEIDIVNARGEIRSVRINSSPTTFNSKPANVLVIKDITEDKKILHYLEESKNRFKALYDLSPSAIYETDKNGGCLAVNKVWRLISGLTEKEALGSGWIKAIHPDDRDSVFKKWNEFSKKGKDWELDYRFKNVKNGEITWVKGEAVTRTNAEGVIIGYIGTNTIINELKATEKKFSTFFNESLSGSFISTPSGKLIDCNQAFIDMLEYPDKKTALTVNTKTLYEKIKYRNNKIERLRNHEKIYQYEEELICFDGRKINVISNIWGDYDTNGNLQFIQGFVQNITDIKESQNKLIASEKRYKTLSESAPVGVWHADKKGNMTYINPKVTEITSLTVNEATGGKWNTRVHPDDRKRRQKEWDEFIAGGKPYKSIYRFLHENGTVRWVLENGTIIDAEPDQSIRHIGTITDITESVKAEQNLKESELRYKNVIEHSIQMFYVHDTNNVISYVSPQSKQILGYNPDELMVNWTKLATVNPINKEAYELTEKAIKTGKTQKPYLLELQRKDGEKILVRVNETPLKDENGKVIGITGSLENVTQQKEAEEKIKLSEKRYRSIIEDVQLLGLILDTNGNIILANKYFLKKTGWKKKEILGKDYFEIFVSKKNRPKVKTRFKEIVSNNNMLSDRTNELITKSGQRLAIKWSVIPEYDDDGNLVSATSLGEDITKQLQTEKDLKFRSDLIKQSNESIITTDTNFKISWTNKAFTRLFGYNTKEVIGKTPDFLNAEPLSEEIQADIYETVSKGKLYKNTLQNVKKDGTKFFCQLTISPIFDEKNRIIAYSGHQFDVTDEVNAMQALANSEERYHDLFEHQIEAYAYHEIILNKKREAVDYKFIDVNDQFLKELNIKNKKDVIGKTLFELNPDIDKKWIQHYGKVALTGEPKKFEDRFAQNGKWYKIYAYSPKIGYFATSFIDITDEKRSEKELQDYKNSLEDIVDKRTKELQKKNEELDNALKVFVGRELTIKNLTNEINKLKKELNALKRKGN